MALDRGYFVFPSYIPRVIFGNPVSRRGLEKIHSWIYSEREERCPDPGMKCLNVTLAPSLACNLQCDYCFQMDSTGISRRSFRSSPVGALESNIKFLKKTLEDEGYGECSITFLGGEPYLIPVAPERCHREIKNITKVTEVSIVSHFGHQYQLISRINKTLGVSRVQVTLDGGRRVHDSFRSRRGGGGPMS